VADDEVVRVVRRRTEHDSARNDLGSSLEILALSVALVIGDALHFGRTMVARIRGRWGR
jgi:hypothetical protein